MSQIRVLLIFLCVAVASGDVMRLAGGDPPSHPPNEAEMELRALNIPDGAQAKDLGSRSIKGINARLTELRLNGHLVGERFFRVQLPSGKVGELLIERTCDADGTLHGYEKTFHANGKLYSEVPYRHGVVDGAISYWSDDGKLLGGSRLIRGTGLWREFDFKGQLSREMALRSGLQHGICREFGRFRNDGGIGRSECEYQSGKLEGWCRVYDEDGTLRSESYSADGKLHCVRRTWNRDGNQEPDSPKFYLRGREVASPEYMEAAKSDLVLRKSLETGFADR